MTSHAQCTVGGHLAPLAASVRGATQPVSSFLFTSKMDSGDEATRHVCATKRPRLDGGAAETVAPAGGVAPPTDPDNSPDAINTGRGKIREICRHARGSLPSQNGRHVLTHEMTSDFWGRGETCLFDSRDKLWQVIVMTFADRFKSFFYLILMWTKMYWKFQTYLTYFKNRKKWIDL